MRIAILVTLAAAIALAADAEKPKAPKQMALADVAEWLAKPGHKPEQLVGCRISGRVVVASVKATELEGKHLVKAVEATALTAGVHAAWVGSRWVQTIVSWEVGEDSAARFHADDELSVAGTVAKAESKMGLDLVGGRTRGKDVRIELTLSAVKAR